MKPSAYKVQLLATTFITGAVVLVIEILGTRVLAPFYGSTIYVWSSLISVTLGALSLGYFIGGKAIDRYPTIKSLFLTIGISSVFAILPMKIDQWVLPFTDKFGLAWGSLVAAGLLFALPLFFLGMVSPMIVRLLSNEVGRTGSVAGTVFAVGTLGSITGAIFSGFYLLPNYTLTDVFNFAGGTLLILAFANALIGKKFTVKTSAVIVVLFIAVSLSPKYLLTDTYTLEIESQEQSRYADLKVINIAGSHCLAANGFTQSCTNSSGEPGFSHIYEIQKLAEDAAKRGDVEGEPYRILLLGIGAGDILGYFPAEAYVDAVDIDPKVIAIAQKSFGLKSRPNHQIVIDDARSFLRKSEKSYDLIVYDAYLGGGMPPHLLTREAFSLYADHLNTDGVMMINIGGRPSAEDALLTSVLRTAKEVLPHMLISSTHPQDPAFFQPVMVYLSKNESFSGLQIGSNVPEDVLQIADREVLTDDGKAVDIIGAVSFEAFRKKMIGFGGYRMMFAL